VHRAEFAIELTAPTPGDSTRRTRTGERILSGFARGRAISSARSSPTEELTTAVGLTGAGRSREILQGVVGNFCTLGLIEIGPLEPASKVYPSAGSWTRPGTDVPPAPGLLSITSRLVRSTGTSFSDTMRAQGR